METNTMDKLRESIAAKIVPDSMSVIEDVIPIQHCHESNLDLNQMAEESTNEKFIELVPVPMEVSRQVIPGHDGPLEEHRPREQQLVLERVDIDPAIYVEVNGNLIRTTEIFVQSKNTNILHHTENTDDQKFVQRGQGTKRKRRPSNTEFKPRAAKYDEEPSEKSVRDIISRLGNAKQMDYVKIEEIKQAIAFIKQGKLKEDGQVVTMKEFPVQASRENKSDQAFKCRVCEALDQNRLFKTKDALNKHVRSHFYQLLNKKCEYCGLKMPRMDNHKAVCPANPKKRDTTVGVANNTSPSSTNHCDLS